jgi:hypothetical protein
MAREVFFQEVLEEGLRDVLGVFMALPGTADVGIKRLPISLTERFQGRPAFRWIQLGGIQDHSPAGGIKRGIHPACGIMSI